MPQRKSIPLLRNSAFRELLAIAVLTASFFWIAVALDLFDWLVAFPVQHKDWRIPEITGAILFLAIGLGAFAIRRWYEHETVAGKLSATCRELERQTGEMQLLSEMTDLLQSCLTVEEASRIVVRFGQLGFPTCSGGIYLFGRTRNQLEPSGLWGEPKSEDAGFAPNDCWAHRRGLPHVMDGLNHGPRCSHIDSRFTGWALCVPMAALGETVGILYLCGERSAADQSVGRRNHDSLRDAKLAGRFAATAATAIANLNLRETLREQSIRDPLTGLFNRRYLEELLTIEMGRAVRKHRPLGIIMIDADHFKRVNDTHGHEAGDKILRALGDFFTRNVRKEDLACRYGGEEFVLVLPEANQDAVLGRANRLRDEVRNLIVLHEGLRLESVTISAGVSAYPNHGKTGEVLIQAADAALYQAKAQGRDRVELAASTETQVPNEKALQADEPAPEPV